MNAKQIKSKLTAAFSLIELMVVVAIIALLTAIAVPSYKSYIQQARVGEITNLMSSFSEQWQAVDNGTSTFCPPTAVYGKYIASVAYRFNGTTCTAGNAIANSPNGTGFFAVTLGASAPGTDIDPSMNNLVITMTATEVKVGSASALQNSATGNSMFVWTCTLNSTGSSSATAATLLGNLTTALGTSGGSTTCTP
jgi:type IV pilus assembly protein PilE